MFKEMRRKRQLLTDEESCSILKKGTSGVLALSLNDDYPYAVPINYVFDGEKIYFHCAKSGHKLDIIKENDKSSFCVIDQDLVVPEKYTTYYRSVIVFGKIHIIEDENEKRKAIEKLAIKYAPLESEFSRNKEIDSSWKALCMLEMTIDYMSGKKAKELVNKDK